MKRSFPLFSARSRSRRVRRRAQRAPRCCPPSRRRPERGDRCARRAELHRSSPIPRSSSHLPRPAESTERARFRIGPKTRIRSTLAAQSGDRSNYAVQAPRTSWWRAADRPAKAPDGSRRDDGIRLALDPRMKDDEATGSSCKTDHIEHPAEQPRRALLRACRRCDSFCPTRSMGARRELLVPAVDIEDAPRFRYRGMHLDVGAALLAGRRCQEVHRPDGDVQAQHVPLAPHRRPGLAHRDQEVPEAHRGRRLAQGDADRPRPGDGAAKFDGQRTAASTRKTRSATSSPTPPSASSPSCPRSRCPGTRAPRSPPIPSSAARKGPFEVATTWGSSRTSSARPRRRFAFLEDVLTEVMALFPAHVHPHRRRRSAQGALEGEPASRRSVMQARAA